MFGGSAPYINARFIELELDWLVSGYIMVLCVLTLIATLVMKETRAIDLHTVGHREDEGAGGTA